LASAPKSASTASCPGLASAEAEGRAVATDVAYFKDLVAKALIFKAVHKTARPLVSAFLANVAAYTVAVVSRTYGSAFDLERVWGRQGVSPQFVRSRSRFGPGRWPNASTRPPTGR
jgi:hypothetical protein